MARKSRGNEPESRQEAKSIVSPKERRQEPTDPSTLDDWAQEVQERLATSPAPRSKQKSAYKHYMEQRGPVETFSMERIFRKTDGTEVTIKNQYSKGQDECQFNDQFNELIEQTDRAQAEHDQAEDSGGVLFSWEPFTNPDDSAPNDTVREADPNLQGLIELEQRLRTELVKADRQPGGASPDEIRNWWAAVRSVWEVYAREIAKNRSPIPPGGLAIVMARMAAELSSGIIPKYIADVAVRGNPPMGYWETRDIGVAVAYRKACDQEGILHNSKVVKVDDLHPTKTIAQAYGVHESTVQGWCRKYQPAFLGVNDINAEVLKGLMEASGRRYQQAGRSKTAIRLRNAKG